MNCPYCDRTIGEDVGDCFKPGSRNCVLEMTKDFIFDTKTLLKPLQEIVDDFEKKVKVLYFS